MQKCRYDGRSCDAASLYGSTLDAGKVRLIDGLCSRCWRASKAFDKAATVESAVRLPEDQTDTLPACRNEDRH